MSQPETLADMVIRDALKPNLNIGKGIMNSIIAARKFVLDSNASEFLADLRYALAEDEDIDHARQLARLPHNPCWFEYQSKPYWSRVVDTYDNCEEHEDLKDLDSPRYGWLLSKPTITDISVINTLNPDTCVLMEIFKQSGNKASLAPIYIYWSTTTDILDKEPGLMSSLLTGNKDYASPHVMAGIVVPDHVKDKVKGATELLKVLSGELARAWAILAAINDAPFGVKEIIPAKGFVTKGKYKKFMTHSLITIDLPKLRDRKGAARKVFEHAKRRAHTVRGHWRRDWRKDGNKIWIREHQRGDAALGFVLHDYAVKHTIH